MNNIWQSTLKSLATPRIKIENKLIRLHHAVERKEANKLKILTSDVGDPEVKFTRKYIEESLNISKSMANVYLREMLEDKHIVVHKPAGKTTMAIYKFNNE